MYIYIHTCAYICSVSNAVAVVVNNGVILILHASRAKAISIRFALQETDERRSWRVLLINSTAEEKPGTRCSNVTKEDTYYI